MEHFASVCMALNNVENCGIWMDASFVSDIIYLRELGENT